MSLLVPSSHLQIHDHHTEIQLVLDSGILKFKYSWQRFWVVFSPKFLFLSEDSVVLLPLSVVLLLLVTEQVVVDVTLNNGSCASIAVTLVALSHVILNEIVRFSISSIIFNVKENMDRQQESKN